MATLQRARNATKKLSDLLGSPPWLVSVEVGKIRSGHVVSVSVRGMAHAVEIPAYIDGVEVVVQDVTYVTGS